MGLTRARMAPTVELWSPRLRELMMFWRGAIAQSVLCTGLILVSTQAVAAALSQPDLNDISFWFKLILGIAIGVGGWFLTKHDAKLEKLYESNLINRMQLMEHEWRNARAEISLLRETLPKDYYGKEEMREHFRKVEDSLKAIHTRMDVIRDTLHSPSRSISSR